MIGLVDVMAAKISPDMLELGDPRAQALRPGRQHDRVNGTGRRAADDGKRIGRAARQQLGYCFEHTYLESAAGAATR